MRRLQTILFGISLSVLGLCLESLQAEITWVLGGCGFIIALAGYFGPDGSGR